MNGCSLRGFASNSEDMKFQFHRPSVGCVIGAVLCLGFGLSLMRGPFGGRDGLMDRWSFDLSAVRHGQSLPPEAVLILQNENSVRGLTGGTVGGTVNRRHYAALVTRLREWGARLIVFDMVFADPALDPADDREFIRTLGSGRDVVIARRTYTTEREGLVSRESTEPLPSIAVAAVGVGDANLARDPDHVIRHYTAPTVDSYKTNFPLAAEALRQMGRPLPKLEARKFLHYYAPLSQLPAESLVEILTNRALDLSGRFRDRVVFVGTENTLTATGAQGDSFGTPYTQDSRTGQSPGVALHAMAFLNLYHGDWIDRCSGGWITLATLFLGIVVGGGLVRLPPIWCAAAGLALGWAIYGIAILLPYALHVWLPWLPWIFMVAVAVVWSVTFNGIQSYAERQVLRQTLSMHLSPRRAKQILRHPELLKPGGEIRDVTLMFSDIAGFSRFAQRKHPTDLIRWLNAYYEVAIQAVHETDGTVMDLIGDSIFALWNAPESQSDHIQRACRCAVALQKNLVAFDQAQLGAPLRTRVGLHRGDACVGNIGSSRRFDYTALGDAVNLASRLEGLNKQLGTSVLATRDVQREVEDSIPNRLLGQFRFQGFDRVVEVYELLGTPDDLTPAAREAFSAGMHAFERREWAGAEEAFNRCLAKQPADGPSKFYLTEIDRNRRQPPPSDWLGEIDLRSK